MFSAGDSSGDGISLNQFGSLRGSVDWAALAQQWIQMRDNNISGAMSIPDAPPPPNISGNYLDIRTGSSKGVASVVPLKKPTFEEKGEADMDMDEDEERASRNESPPPPAPSMQLGKTRAEVMQSQQLQSGIPPAQWFVQQQQPITQVALAPTALAAPSAALVVPPSELGNGNGQHKTTPTQWNANAWPPHVTLPPPTPVMQLPVVATNANPTAHIPPLMKINVSNPNSTKTEEPNSGSVTMDAAKRKILPAWIREGLEKMEREKQKQLERQQSQTKDGLGDVADAKSDAIKPALQSSEHTVKSKTTKFLESDSSGNEDDDAAVASIGVGAGDIKALAAMFTKSKTPAALPPASAVGKAHKMHSDDGDSETTEAEADPETDTEADRLAGVGKRSYEERLADLMIVVRRTLTELLLEVTNDEIFKISQEAVNSRKAKASSAQVIRKSALSSITGKLGLAAYDDSSGDDSSLSDNEASADNDSIGDSEEEIKASIRTKRRAFAKVSEDIEERIAASVLREEQKLKYYTHMEQQRLGKLDASLDNADEQPQSANKAAAATVSKGYERDFGETTDSKLQHSNGKRQKERSSRKERTTRFSDNKDSKSASIAAAATYISQMQTSSSSSLTTTIAAASNQPTTLFPIATSAVSALTPASVAVDVNNLYTASTLSGSSVVINKNLLNAAEAAIEKATKARSDKPTDNRSDRHHRRRENEREHERHHGSHRSHGGRHSSDDDNDSSSSSSSTSNSSRHSKYSRASSTRHKHDERSASSRKRSRSRERRHHRRRHHSSTDEYDDDRSSRRHGAHRSSTRRRSRSRSRSSYSSSSRRHRH